MKQILFFLLFWSLCLQSFGQKYFIPFRDGDKSYLQNENGKKVIDKGYDLLYWDKGAFFVGGTIQERVNPGTPYGFNTYLSDIIYRGKVILRELPLDKFSYILDEIIVARNTSFHKPELFKPYNITVAESIILFNTKGKTLLNGPVKHMALLDTTGTSRQQPHAFRYILLLTRDFNDLFSLYVYDADADKIARTVLKDVTILKEHAYPDKRNGVLYFSIQENNKITPKVFHYKDGNFKLSDAAMPVRQQEEAEEDPYYTGNIITGKPGIDGDSYRSPDADPMKPRPAPIPYLRIQGDSVLRMPDIYNRSGESVLHVKLTPQQRLIPKLSNEYRTGIIYLENGKFGIINLQGKQPAIYDSLFYFDQAVFVVHQNNRKGIIGADGDTLLPVIYDSLAFDIDQIRTRHTGIHITNSSDSKRRNFEFRNTGVIKVVKDGKTGLYGRNFKVIFPVEYDFIAQNDIYTLRPKKNIRYILKKGSAYYGLPNYGGDMSGKMGDPYEYIPLYYYENYYNIDGLKLIELYDEAYQFKGFISDKGQKYYK